jgi:hypothetical protein
MLKKLLVCTLFMFTAFFLKAQNNLGAFSGKVLNGTENVAKALEAATISVKNESTGFQAKAITNKLGFFKIEDLPLGGPYSLMISHVGFNSVSLKGFTLNLGDNIIIADVLLSSVKNDMAEIVVSGSSYKSGRDRIGVSTKISGEALNRIPTSSRNYLDLAQLSPLTKGTSIAGSRGNARGFTIDGVSSRMHMFGSATEGAFPISMETIREFEVSTNTYNVSDGRGGAGAVKAITKSGTNQVHGAAWSYYTGGKLAGVQVNNVKDQWSKGKKGENTNTQFGAYVSGPIVKDKIHFFLSFDRFSQKQPWRTWDFENNGVSQSDAENTLGITKTNLDKIVTQLETNFGVPKVQQYGNLNIERITDNLFGRFDFNLSEKNHLTVRSNYHVYLQPDKAPGGGLFSTQYKGRQRDATFLVNLTSRISYNLKNDLKLSYGDYKRTGNNVYPRVPVGVVKVQSVLPNGQSKTVNVLFGNQYWAPETIASNDLQIVDNLTFTKGKINWLFGTDLQFNRINDLLTHYQQGEFVYNSLDNLLQNKPDEFNRKVPVGEGAGKPVHPSILTTGVYGQGSWKPNNEIEITAGLRYDLVALPSKPKADALLQKELGINSNVAPLDWNNFQPRFNLIWDIKGKGTDIFKFGFGWMTSEFTSQAMSFALINNAGNYKSVSIRKGDVNMPSANWAAFHKDFANVPGYENWIKPNGINLDNIPNAVHVLDKNLETPMTFKMNIDYTKFITNKFYVSGGFYLNRTVKGYMLENKNLADNPKFSVAEENNRGVYVAPNLIASNGLADYKNARKSTRFNEVLMFTNASWPQLSWFTVLEGAYKIKDGELRASYTYGHSKGGVRYNSGNPQDMFITTTSYNSYKTVSQDWNDDDDLRHKVVFSALSPSWKGFSATATVILGQWNNFYSNLNRDQNGDNTSYSANEDMSYIFDPATAPAAIKADLNYVWQNTSSYYRTFLNKYKGDFGGMNGGMQPWRSQFDLSLLKDFKFKNSNKVSLRLDIFNVLNLVNYKWGGYKYVSNTRLYQITGFNATTQKYTYTVDKDAGNLRYIVDANRLYRIQIGLKYSF